MLQAACSHAGCRPFDNKTLAVRLATDAARLKRGLHSQRCPHQRRVQDPLRVDRLAWYVGSLYVMCLLAWIGVKKVALGCLC